MLFCTNGRAVFLFLLTVGYLCKNSFVSNSVHQDVQKSHSTHTPPRLLCFIAHTGNIKALQSSRLSQNLTEPSYSTTGNACPLTYGAILFTVYFANT